ncbi:RNA ligase [Yinghuangia seranimata]|uniref:RNA ligase n=1 Tax=Yinghuangia seranimata TaxID=408067 RepID=UPI00248A8FDD|nr:RNA ligase [Yinghuangia seranimata]MDI2131494.1 RNA ligase [Yinghuangia seranimata]
MPAAPESVPAPPRLSLAALLPPEELAAEVAAGRVRRTRHPDPALPLSVYAYGPQCVFANHWTPVTRRARGLVVDDESGEVVALTFPKFFNYDQHQAGSPFAPELPHGEPFEVFDKLDGSLGIVFHYGGRWHAATKSAFASEQALWAQAWLAARDTAGLTPGTTYLAEIIYPRNRIVVDNGDRKGLVLLGAFAADGTELPLSSCADAWRSLGGDVVAAHPAPPLDTLVRHARADLGLDGRPVSGTEAEGWVVRFASGLRVKVKSADYVRLHGAMSRTTERGVWEVLSAGDDPAVLFDRMPDEFRAWILDTANRLRAAHQAWTAAAEAAYAQVLAAEAETGTDARPDRPAFARLAAAHPREVRSALFLLYDGRPIDALAWRHIKPAAGAPFITADAG